jgi:hypothetical protein
MKARRYDEALAHCRDALELDAVAGKPRRAEPARWRLSGGIGAGRAPALIAVWVNSLLVILSGLLLGRAAENDSRATQRELSIAEVSAIAAGCSPASPRRGAVIRRARVVAGSGGDAFWGSYARRLLDAAWDQ